MASRKPEPAPFPPLSDEAVWLLACLVGELLLIIHDGQKLSDTGAAHFGSDNADRVLEEFRRRFRQ